MNCLSISLDDFTLASGSADGTIRIWDTYSRQCIKVINQNAEVTNIEFKLRTIFFNDEPNLTPALFNVILCIFFVLLTPLILTGVSRTPTDIRFGATN